MQLGSTPGLAQPVAAAFCCPAHAACMVLHASCC
jgi:hypothetical protein